MNHFARIATLMASTQLIGEPTKSVDEIEARLRNEFTEEELLVMEFQIETEAENMIRAARAAGMQLAVVCKDLAGNVRIQADDGSPFPEPTKQ